MKNLISPPTNYPEDRALLAALRVDMVSAINRGDIEGIVALLHPNVVVTWQDGSVCRGREQVHRFYLDMAAKKSKRAFQGFKVPPTPDELTILYSGATAGVVYGYNVGRFFLLGREVEMHNRWTATVVKEQGEWLIAGYHVSMNILDNPLLNGVKKTAIVGAGAALLLGFLGGKLLGGRCGEDDC
jgi:ketosteroid isomerase-like protein